MTATYVDPKTADWIDLLDEFGTLGSAIYENSRDVQGLNTDPAIIATIIFNRLWSHFRSFALLWRNHLQLDADTVLRSACEASICLANIDVRPEEFMEDIRSDAASTLKGQIKIWRELPAMSDQTKEAEDHLRKNFGPSRPDGQSHKKLDMQILAMQGGVPQIYRFYKSNSGTRTHVSGLSLLFHVADGPSDEALANFRRSRDFEREQAIASMCVVMGVGCIAYCRIASLPQLSDAIELSLRGRQLGQRGE